MIVVQVQCWQRLSLLQWWLHNNNARFAGTHVPSAIFCKNFTSLVFRRQMVLRSKVPAMNSTSRSHLCQISFLEGKSKKEATMQIISILILQQVLSIANNEKKHFQVWALQRRKQPVAFCKHQPPIFRRPRRVYLDQFCRWCFPLWPLFLSCNNKLPRGGMYWKIRPLRQSWGPRGANCRGGAYFPIHPDSRQWVYWKLHPQWLGTTQRVVLTVYI